MIARIGLSGSVVILLVGMGATTSSVVKPTASAQDLISPNKLVRTTVAHEVAATKGDSIRHMFRDRKKTPQGSQTRIYVETCEAMAGMTIASNDKPLTQQELQREEGRLADLARNSQQLRHKQREQKEDAERTLSIVKALPEAFLYQADGEEIGTASLGHEGRRLVRLKFRPNPAYRPPSHVEDVLVGMDGFLLIDPEAQRIARIDGTLFKEVTFGWGILGHLDKGGHFYVEQADLGDGSWDVTHMRLEFAGKVLLFKSIAIKSDEVFSNFKRVPSETTFAEGVKMLKAAEAGLAERGGETARAERKRR